MILPLTLLFATRKGNGEPWGAGLPTLQHIIRNSSKAENSDILYSPINLHRNVTLP